MSNRQTVELKLSPLLKMLHQFCEKVFFFLNLDGSHLISHVGPMAVMCPSVTLPKMENCSKLKFFLVGRWDKGNLNLEGKVELKCVGGEYCNTCHTPIQGKVFKCALKNPTIPLNVFDFPLYGTHLYVQTTFLQCLTLPEMFSFFLTVICLCAIPIF